MIFNSKVRTIILYYVKELSEENGKIITAITDDQNIMDDLGLTSLQIATLISHLENEIEVDPFSDGNASITDIRTIGDLCKLYENIERMENS